MVRVKWPNTSVCASKLCGTPPGPASKVRSTALNGLKLSPVIVVVPVSGAADVAGVVAGFSVVLGARALKVSELKMTAAAGWKQFGFAVIVAGERIAVALGPLSQSTKWRLLLCTSSPSAKLACTATMPGSGPLAYLTDARPVLFVLDDPREWPSLWPASNVKPTSTSDPL